ncbi:hypothetical protein BS47DRAFT_1139547 [Hydnum rufescens UP504]|uniref:F-box domain-containing protein n=1 Tax=Hydnum rufescens UP504 TaxID=1448309 RepID=A0A9P6ATM9_9AGAM|nr:hypothetical protein BS47DRAFT_1139547 [Hydnum rufescens UP504]
MSSNLDLLALPLELLIHIFALLEGHHIVRCIAVCSYFKHAIENSIMLQCLIKLDMFGYMNGPGREDTVRLNQLERHIDSWNKLDWVESRIDVPRWRYGPGVLREGIYALPPVLQEWYASSFPLLTEAFCSRRGPWDLNSLCTKSRSIQVVIFLWFCPGSPGASLLHVTSLSISGRFPTIFLIQMPQVPSFSRLFQ